MIVIGLDNAGKSSLISTLKGEPAETVPTLGFCSTKMHIENVAVELFDVGGGKSIRGIWPNFFSKAHGVVFVIDSSDEERFAEAKDCFHEAITHEYVSGKPILICANKQDVRTACKTEKIRETLAVPETEGFKIIGTIAKRGTVGMAEAESSLLRDVVLPLYDEVEDDSEEGIEEGMATGMKWLMGECGSQIGVLAPRVQRETKEEQKKQEKQKKEKEARVKQQKLARERETKTS
ncbi:putative ADP-ribosylation factor H [Blattamonas nauphoetae]|uniref:ADP-ribosylation factor H n=1 Tax=Blattamonas nauphoetae TaxID=2049346 RepID=A0ABQ9Y141_9EUKA|nr:putative ADP-ribosylation factor H [Blattamonas nauphoetae]